MRHRRSVNAIFTAAMGGLSLCGLCIASGCSEGGQTAKGPAPVTRPAGPYQARSSSHLVAPKTSAVEDVNYFTDLAKVDPDLATYVNTWDNVALRALLTDGSAFCAFLEQSKSIDDAMASLVIGARSVEKQTHLPVSVKTFNAVDAVALVVLCPSEVKLLPSVDQSHVDRLRAALGTGAATS